MLTRIAQLSLEVSIYRGSCAAEMSVYNLVEVTKFQSSSVVCGQALKMIAFMGPFTLDESRRQGFYSSLLLFSFC